VAQGLAEGVVRPLQVVEALRRQRVNMVQTKVYYYIFIVHVSLIIRL